jgi:HD-like signal output (HDOD) protein
MAKVSHFFPFSLVLRIANTARYSPLRCVSSLREASAILGMTTLRNLALAMCMAKAFPAVAGLDRRRFWCRGIATADYAALVGRATLVDPDVAYLGGLMLQAGQLLMMQIEPRDVVELESRIQHPGDRFRLEQERWHCTHGHGDVTAELARRWKFSTSTGCRSACSPWPTWPPRWTPWWGKSACASWRHRVTLPPRDGREWLSTT